MFIEIIRKIFIFLKSELGTEALIKNKRKYGADLDKFEPLDLTNILIPSPEQLDSIPNDFVRETMMELRETDNFPTHASQFLRDLFK